MPRLTIIVPLMDQVDAFEMTLASVLRYAGSQVEVLAAIAGDYQDQYGILDEISSVFVDCRSTTVLSRAALAAGAATSTWIYWLAPGIEMTQDALEGALKSVQQRDLGMASPRVAARTASTDVSNSAPENPAGCCLASSVVLTDRFHPVCLEELIGEEWSAADLSPQLNAVGPTLWAGLVQRRLLAQWASTDGPRLPSGYVEVSLGLFVQQNGWSHEWVAGDLLANEVIAAEIEAGYRPCGRSSNRIIGLATATSRRSVYWTAVRAGLSEAARGCLSPKLWRVAWERLTSLSLVRRRNAGTLPLPSSDVTSGENEHHSHPLGPQNESQRHANRRKSVRSAA
ncbi:MAG: hypothetical protein Q8M16_00565 [Pirellulaceae bacterium]|nr:hypothetical protein [Pirellulaceae bacterium]